MIRSGREVLDFNGRLGWRPLGLALVLVLLTLSGSLLGVAPGVEAQGNEERAVIEAAQAVFDAMETLILRPSGTRWSQRASSWLSGSRPHAGAREMSSRPA